MPTIKRYWVAMVIIGAMLTMIGCTNRTSDNNQPAGPSSKSNSEQKEAEKKDFGTIRIIRNKSYTDNDKVAAYIKEKSGVKVEMVWSDPAVDKFTLMIASGEPVDAVARGNVTFLNEMKKGTLMPLSKLIDTYGPNLKKNIKPELWEFVKDDAGEIYGIPSEALSIPNTLQIRADWLQEQNLQMPKTIEEFERVMLKFKDAYKTSPLLIDYADKVLGGAFLPNGYSWWKNDKGVYLPPEMHPDYKNLLATLNSWYKQGILHTENYIYDRHVPLFEDNKVGALMGWFSTTFPSTMKLRDKYPKAEYKYVPPLKGKYDAGYYISTIPAFVVEVSANSKNAAGVIKFLDWLSADADNMRTGIFGLQDTHWAYVNKDKNIIKTFPDSEKRYAGGTLEVLDMTKYSARFDTTDPNSDKTLPMYYDYMDLLDSGKVKPAYVPNELKAAINDGALKSADVLAEVTAAAEEAKKQIIMGAKPLSYWDEFLDSWVKIGMGQVIEEKGKMIAARLK
ncbi:MAG: extracellular solute-binding protein [Paenibacillaceae bacterium]|nr:extracellular solute-binding protein [Paenibacillaceae bacterium]